MKTVYLAGPIDGMTFKGANGWRQYVHDRLLPVGIIGVSPLRCEPLRKGQDTYTAAEGVDPKFGTSKAIGSKNIHDVRNCDMTLCFLPGPRERISLGTICELAGAHFINKQTIMVTDDPYLMSHPVIDAMSGWKLSNMDDAIEVIIGVLGGYTKEGKHV